MNFRKISVCFVLIIISICAVSYEYGFAEPKKDSQIVSKIAVVNIRQIVQNCQKGTAYKAEFTTERERAMSELEKMKLELDLLKADMDTRKTGSSDYMTLVQQSLEKQASLQARQEFYQQQMALKEHQWTEKLYLEILELVSQIAEQKGLEMVFEKDDLDLPTANATELMLAIRTHKLLYSKDYLDITSEVLQKLDAKD